MSVNVIGFAYSGLQGLDLILQLTTGKDSRSQARYAFNFAGDQVNIRSIDEAIVIGAALSLSSSAFVLQLLAEKGELPTRFGSATLGIPLLQDIAVVPLLVILPVLEGQIAQEFVLGEYDPEATAAYNQNLSDISILKDPHSKDASQRYHAHQYTNGTVCDLTNQHRETESSVLVYLAMLKHPKSFEDYDLGNIIRDVASLLERNWMVTVFHASRSVNFVANRLAIMGRTKIKTEETVPFTYPPADLFETYASEIPDMAA